VKKLFMLALTLLMVAAMAISAQAVPTIDFDMSPSTPGTIVFNGTTLVGTDIQVDSVTGLDTNANDGVTFPITNGLLSFKLDNFVGLGDGEYEFGFSGNITITGGVNGGAADIVLLQSTSLAGPSTPHVAITSSGGTVLFNFFDIKDSDLLSLFGTTGNFWKGNINLSFAVEDGINPDEVTKFTSSFIGSGDVINTPIPGSLLLLGTGLLGIFGIGIRRKSA
jgi:hypothetical protein